MGAAAAEPTTLRVPITNVYAGGDYTAQLAIGSEGAAANVILDTGSSTLAVAIGAYDPTKDTLVQKTSLAQDVVYGTGGWSGPVVQTKLTLGQANGVSLTTYLALTVESEPGNFGNANGILGLAFNALNSAYDLSAYLQEQGINPAYSYPWPFPIKDSPVAVKQFYAFLQRNMPEHDLPPYFTAAEMADITHNKFAFYTLRSVPSVGSSNPTQDPLNNGFFILGGGEEEKDLYTGEFVSVDVVDDLYYNTDLLAVQVGDQPQVSANPLPAQYGKSMVSNSIIDSGTNSLLVAPDVFSAITKSLGVLNASFLKQIEAADSSQGIAASAVDLAQWPTITFVLRGPTGDPVRLGCSPSTYWQVDAPAAGQAMFQIANVNGPQSILGLPLLNNYYAVFDRTADAYGEIMFAPIAPVRG